MSRKSKVFMAVLWALAVVACVLFFYGFASKSVNTLALLVSVCIVFIAILPAGITAIVSAKRDVQRHPPAER